MPMPNLPIKTGHLFIGMAVVMGIATMGVFSSGGKQTAKAPPAPKVETENVVVPLVQINQGETVSSNDVTIVKWPSAYLPKGATFSDSLKVSGRVAKQTLFPGEPIFMQKVSGSNSEGGLTALIPNGMRAVTVAVTEIKGVAGFVKPGDRVDILTTFELSREGSESLRKTKTVLQNVLVLASAQTMVKDEDYKIETPDGVNRGDATTTQSSEKTGDKADKKAATEEEIQKRVKERQAQREQNAKEARLVSSVTLALSPLQTETIALAEESGDLRLVLRPESDNSIADLQGMDSDHLLGKPRSRQDSISVSHAPPANFTPAVPPPPPGGLPMPAPILGAQVEFIQGNDKTIYNFNQ